jgi:hypothetical protein
VEILQLITSPEEISDFLANFFNLRVLGVWDRPVPDRVIEGMPHLTKLVRMEGEGVTPGKFEDIFEEIIKVP